MITFTELYKAKKVLWRPRNTKYYIKHTKYEAWENHQMLSAYGKIMAIAYFEIKKETIAC
jgi:hypothetical protein